MTQPFTLKPDAVYDISGNDLGTPLEQANPKPYGIISRASYATYWGSPYMPYATYDAREDPGLTDAIQSCRALGIREGAYAYLLQGKMDKQIQAFVDACSAAGLIVNGKWAGRIPAFADVEVEVPQGRPKKTPKNYIEPISGTKWADQVHQWLLGIEEAIGGKPAIYTARYQWLWLLDRDGNPPAWTKDYLFWLKWYPDPYEYIDKNTTFPLTMLPTGVDIEQVIIWQYFQYGRSEGFQYNDINTITEAGKRLFESTGEVTTSTPPSTPPSPPVTIPAGWIVSEQSDSRIVLVKS